jgi:hypothetical protein
MMIVCWGALRDCLEAMVQCARDSGALFAWLLANANRPHPADASLTSADMDALQKSSQEDHWHVQTLISAVWQGWILILFHLQARSLMILLLRKLAGSL